MAKPNTNEPFVPDPAMVAALAAVKKAEDVAATMTARLATETANFAVQEAHRIELALPACLEGGKAQTAYDAASAEADKTRARIEGLQGAQRAADQKVVTAKEELQKLGRATVIASQVRCGNARMKAAVAVQEAIGSLGIAYNKLLDANERNLLCWPNVAVIPSGAFITPKETAGLIAIEFARVSSPADPLAGDARPPLPGSASTTFLGNPKELKPFVAEIEASNTWLLRLVKTGK
jgi:hypothetical protein